MCIKTAFGIICDMSGPTMRIVAGGKEFLWEWHGYSGPTVLCKNGDVKTKQPDERSPFWDAAVNWDKQGRRMRGHYCVWHYPEERRDKLRHLGGKHFEVIGHDTIPARPGWPTDEVLPLPLPALKEGDA